MQTVRLPELVAVAAEDVRHLRKRSSGLGVPRIVLVATWV
jgi:hypothetical protein